MLILCWLPCCRAVSLRHVCVGLRWNNLGGIKVISLSWKSEAEAHTHLFSRCFFSPTDNRLVSSFGGGRFRGRNDAVQLCCCTSHRISHLVQLLFQPSVFLSLLCCFLRLPPLLLSSAVYLPGCCLADYPARSFSTTFWSIFHFDPGTPGFIMPDLFL